MLNVRREEIVLPAEIITDAMTGGITTGVMTEGIITIENQDVITNNKKNRSESERFFYSLKNQAKDDQVNLIFHLYSYF